MILPVGNSIILSIDLPREPENHTELMRKIVSLQEGIGREASLDER